MDVDYIDLTSPQPDAPVEMVDPSDPIAFIEITPWTEHSDASELLQEQPAADSVQTSVEHEASPPLPSTTTTTSTPQSHSVSAEALNCAAGRTDVSSEPHEVVAAAEPQVPPVYEPVSPVQPPTDTDSAAESTATPPSTSAALRPPELRAEAASPYAVLSSPVTPEGAGEGTWVIMEGQVVSLALNFGTMGV